MVTSVLIKIENEFRFVIEDKRTKVITNEGILDKSCVV